MRTSITLLLTVATIVGASAQNSCSTALLITPGMYTVTAVDGPEAPTPICIATGTATAAEWYRFSVPQDTTVRISTDLGSGVDTRFHVYSGNCGALVCVAGDDDSGNGLTSLATFQAQAGVMYRLAFDDNWTSAGFTFSLTYIEPIVPPAGMVTFSPSTIANLTGGDCVVDMNGDHLDDVVRASTSNVNIQYQLAGGGFQSVNIPTATAENSPSWSIAAGDIDGNGHTDLIYGGGSGASFAIANDDGTAFSIVDFEPYIFCQRTNFVDINNDGHLDAFSCHDVDANVAFYNDGSGNLIYEQGGLGETCGNYGSQWIDYDGDGDIDMFVAKCGCDPTDLLMRNNGDGTFTNVAPELGLSDGHQSWSSAWGDFNNDTHMDVLIGSSSSSYHKLMRNDGDGTFTNVTAGSGYDLFGGQSIEWTTHDFNNDGYLDILGGGALMYGDGDFHFSPDNTAPATNAVGDLNADGFLDIASWNGAFLNNGNSNNWLKVNPMGTVSNTNGIGARVQITSDMGTQIRDIKSGDAFSTMSSMTAHFGVGSNTVLDEVRISWPSGLESVLNDVPVNTTLTIVEGITTSIDTDPGNDQFRVYPNPAEDVLTIEVSGKSAIQNVLVFDVTGKQVLAPSPIAGRVDVSPLPSGLYRIVVAASGEAFSTSFVKD